MARKGNSKTRRQRKSKAKKRQNQKRKPQRGRSRSKTHGQEMREILDWFLPADSIFRSLKLHGNTSWLPRHLVCLALCWVWAENKNVTDSFTYAGDWCRTLTSGPALTTYQGMMNALTVHTEPLMKILQMVLQQRMKQIGKDNWQVGLWVAIAFDGSRDSAPRTVANEDAFCAASYGQGKTAKYRKKKTKGMRRKNNRKNPATPPRPQVWITMMWHMGLRLPWTWRLGPSNTSERADVMDMVRHEKFPKNTLFCGDAGFVGYALWSEMLAAGYHFLVRVGGNVNLLTEHGGCTLKANQRVLSWPRDAMKAGRPPLELRLVHLRVGRTWMWLLTSVLDNKQLNLKEIRELYKQRWGIEVEFRGLKQTLDKRDLRCRNEARVKAELHWSLLVMALTELFALKAQLPKHLPDPKNSADVSVPQKRSLAEAVRAIRWSLTHINGVPDPEQLTLPQKLELARTDDYDRSAGKAARYRPPNPDKKPLGDPNIRKLKPDERKKLKAIKANNLTA